MEKEALLKIILQDVKELETLMNTFVGKENIPDVFLQLARSKTSGILNEIDLLENIGNYNKTVPSETNNPIIEPALQRPIKTEEPKHQPKIEEIIKEETITIVPQIEEKKLPDIEADIAQKPEPIVSQEPVIQQFQNQEKNTPKESKSIGDVLGKDKRSYNDTLASKTEIETSSKFQPSIKDLTKAFGINDRFYYQRELFGGNSSLFSQTIDQLNSMSDYNLALTFLSTNFNWDDSSEAVVNFKELIKRRYI